jgi:hypothetical protein
MDRAPRSERNRYPGSASGGRGADEGRPSVRKVGLKGQKNGESWRMQFEQSGLSGSRFAWEADTLPAELLPLGRLRY